MKLIFILLSLSFNLNASEFSYLCHKFEKRITSHKSALKKCRNVSNRCYKELGYMLNDQEEDLYTHQEKMSLCKSVSNSCYIEVLEDEHLKKEGYRMKIRNMCLNVSEQCFMATKVSMDNWRFNLKTCFDVNNECFIKSFLKHGSDTTAWSECRNEIND